MSERRVVCKFGSGVSRQVAQALVGRSTESYRSATVASAVLGARRFGLTAIRAGGGTVDDGTHLSAERVAAPAAAVIEDVWKGEGTVLIVDDEKMIRDVGQGMLEFVGRGVVGFVRKPFQRADLRLQIQSLLG